MDRVKKDVDWKWEYEEEGEWSRLECYPVPVQSSTYLSQLYIHILHSATRQAERVKLDSIGQFFGARD